MQVNRGRRSDIIIEELTDPSTVEAELHHILAEHHYRKNRNRFYMNREFTTVLKKNLGDRAVILVARKNDRIVGLTIHMRNSTAMQLKFVGIATEMVKSRAAVYFNITYHHLIESACAERYQQLYFGILTYDSKCRRGARLIPTSNWIWEPRRVRARVLRLLLAYQARRQERVLLPFSGQNQVRNGTALPCYKWSPPSKVK